MEVKVIVNGMIMENTYLLINENDVIVIDPGSNSNKIINAIGSRKILAVLLTHGHYDHMEGLKAVINNKNIDVYLHSDEIQLVSDNNFNCSKFFVRNYKFPDIKLRELTEGNLKIGNFNIDILHTPGHTIGSVCYLIKNKLFSGDTMFKDTHGRTDLPTGNAKDMKNSLKYLASLSKDIEVYPGHGEKTTIGYEGNK